MAKNCLIGNGLDKYLNLPTTFKEFIDSKEGQDLLNSLKSILEIYNITITYDKIRDRDLVRVKVTHDLNYLMSMDYIWTEWETMLDYEWYVEKNSKPIINFDVKRIIKQLKLEEYDIEGYDNTDSIRIAINILFEEKFYTYIEGIDFTEKKFYDTSIIEDDDMIINLNYTPTLSKYKNVHHVHSVWGRKKYNIIGSSHDKASNNRIKNNLKKINAINQVQLLIFGCHLHSENGIVDKHILDFLCSYDHTEIIYKNINMTEVDIENLKVNLRNYFDNYCPLTIHNGNVVIKTQVGEDNELPF